MEEEMTVDECNEMNAILASQGGRRLPPRKRCEYCGVDSPRKKAYWVVPRHMEKPHIRHELWCKPCAVKGQRGNTEEYLARYPPGYQIAEKMTRREMMGLVESMPFLTETEPVF